MKPFFYEIIFSVLSSGVFIQSCSKGTVVEIKLLLLVLFRLHLLSNLLIASIKLSIPLQNWRVNV